MTDYTPDPLLVLRLRGTQAEMGAQLGERLAQAGGWEQTSDFYPRMASTMLGLGVPRVARGVARRIFAAAVDINARRLHRARRRHFPEYLARTEAMIERSNAPRSLVRSMGVMDVLQNTVGILGRFGLLEPTGLQVAAVPACTSLAVWGSSSSDGHLRHARNFDFPGAGVWDKAPAVVFCEPDQGLRYGFVTTRGADTPGVTAFNEAGLSLTAHTRFHRDVAFDGVGVVDFGHEIVRTCRSLDDVRRVAGRLRTASSWGILVSSAAEGQALSVEKTAAGTAFVSPQPGCSHLAVTNRYADSEMTRGEITTSDAFVIDSNARWQRADEAVARSGGQMSRDDLQRLLADRGDPEAPDPEADDRLIGNCIANALTVKSVILEPESASVRLSTGVAPTGGGPWVDVAHAWDGPVGEVEPPTPTDPSPAADPRTERDRAAVRCYVTATRRHLAGARPAEVRSCLERAVEAAPSEPNLRFLTAIFAVIEGDFAGAEAHLRRALQRERGDYRRALLLLWHGRVLAALQRHEEASVPWRELEDLPEHPATQVLRAAARRELRRPLPRWRLRTVVPDVFIIDATVPGERSPAKPE